MNASSKASIFPAEQRQVIETDGLKVYNSFMAGSYNQPNSMPFGSLTVLNEIILQGGKGIAILPEENTLFIILVMDGSLGYQDSAGDIILLEKGMVTSFFIKDNKAVLLHNPGSAGLSAFLQIGINAGMDFYASETALPSPVCYNNAGGLFELFGSAIIHERKPYKFFIGKFAGRQEAYHPLNEGGAVFVFVLQGAFEVQNRLLEAKDGLLIWSTGLIEMEALSEEAIILLIEQPFPYSLRD
ncbi:MAG: hypothetical protein ABIN01_10680 [Ferruginibacter sp.]